MCSLPTLIFLLSLPVLTIAQPDCGYNPDYNGDNEIGVPDLLGLLSLFEEQDSDDDGIWDSQDDCIGVEDPCGVCNGTGTDGDGDGLCDDIDDCVGVFDECGVCNGPGPDVPVIEDIVVFYDSTYNEEMEVWFVYEVGADTSFTYICAIAGCTDSFATNYNPEAEIDDGSCFYGSVECGGAATIDFDGDIYQLVAFGNQCWFAENLRTQHYSNGDEIPGGLTDNEWVSTSSGAQAVYGDSEESLISYGRLYNWFAVNDARNICPSGWHVPTDEEWMSLEMTLGMSSVAVNATGWRGTDEGAQMKSSPSNTPSWNGTNTSNLAALPGGLRDSQNGYFYSAGDDGSWWSASPYNSTFAWYRLLYSGTDLVGRVSSHKRKGFSVRCIRD